MLEERGKAYYQQLPALTSGLRGENVLTSKVNKIVIVVVGAVGTRSVSGGLPQ